MSDILERAFGPEDPQPNFRKLDESKIIPFHDCDFAERITAGMWGGTVHIEQCPICGTQKPDLPEG